MTCLCAEVGIERGIEFTLDGKRAIRAAALVAAIYRELTPRGLLPTGLHPVLARLCDLTTLEAHGVEVDEALARETLVEAEAWVSRLGA